MQQSGEVDAAEESRQVFQVHGAPSAVHDSPKNPLEHNSRAALSSGFQVVTLQRIRERHTHVRLFFSEETPNFGLFMSNY